MHIMVISLSIKLVSIGNYNPFSYQECDESLCDNLVNGYVHLAYSENSYGWLGKCLDFMAIINLHKPKAFYDELTF